MNLSYLKFCRAQAEARKKNEAIVKRDSKMQLKMICSKMEGGLFDIYAMVYTFSTCPGKVYLASKIFKN